MDIQPPFRPAASGRVFVLGRRGTPTLQLAAVALATVLVLARLPFLARTLDGIDSVNFALALHDFSVVDHQPHPPGYPVFVAIGRVARAALSMTSSVASTPADQDARALALCAALFGALAVFPLFQFLRRLEGNDRRAIATTLLTVTSPLLLFTAGRPMSDVPGLTAALTVQAILATALGWLTSETPRDPADVSGRGRPLSRDIVRARFAVIAAAFLAGLAIGFRVQVAWLTMPLLIVALFFVARRVGRSIWTSGALAFCIGLLMWMVPLVISSGGPSAYIAILGNQTVDDLNGPTLVAQNPSARNVARALMRTFVTPWAHPALAACVLSCAVTGALVLIRRSPASLIALAITFGPYATFHLLFQDSVFGRYALPLVPPVAYLAVRGLDALSRGLAPLALAVLIAGSLAVTARPVTAYARGGSPTFRLLADVRSRLHDGERPVIAMHHAVARALRGEDLAAPRLPAPLRYEWLEVGNYWKSGGTAPVWFLASSRRTDLALIDPASRQLVRAYRWPFASGAFLGGMRPHEVDWIEIREPGWFAGEGWALTPEAWGVAKSDRRGPDRAPLVGHIRRRPDPVTFIVGGRNYGTPCNLAVRLDIAVDGQPVADLVVRPNRPFVYFGHLRAGQLAGAGPFARLTISSQPVDGSGREVDVAIEQFDLQTSGTRAIYGYGLDWHEPELDPVTGKLWRWTQATSTVHIDPDGHDRMLHLEGASPRGWSGEAALVTLRVGTETVHRVAVSGPFRLDLRLPGHLLRQHAGELTLSTDRTFVPDETSGNGDKRRLGLQIFDVSLR